MKIMRLWMLLAAALAFGMQPGCGGSDDDEADGDDDDDDDDDENQKDLDWFESSCEDLGGVETPAGACFVACQTADDCPIDTMRCTGADVWIMGQCEVDEQTKNTQGCGPEGWHNKSWGCYMICSAEGANDECPSGFNCTEDSITSGTYFCTGYQGSSGGTCGSPCADDCCSPSGLTCCEPPFCSGVCADSPCCY